MQQLRELRRLYGVRTVFLATDDADGKVTGRLAEEKEFNWAYLHYPRSQFKKRGWMEFRKDLVRTRPRAWHARHVRRRPASGACRRSPAPKLSSFRHGLHADGRRALLARRCSGAPLWRRRPRWQHGVPCHPHDLQ